MGTYDQGLSHPRKAPGRLRIVWQAKCVGEVSFHFQFGPGTLGIFMFRQTEIWRFEVKRVIGLYLENCLQTFIDMTCLVLFGGGARFGNLSVPFGYTLRLSVLRNARFEHACMRCEHGPAERSGRIPGVSSCSCPGLETRFWARSVLVAPPRLPIL